MSFDLTKLGELLDELFPEPHLNMTLRNGFALGCYMHSKNEKTAGLKMCRSVLETIGYERRKTYFIELLEKLPGNELDYIRQIECNSEINALLERSAK
jgi:hypothetical protein